MKQKAFSLACGLLAAAGLLAACGQSSDMVTEPVTESESIAAGGANAVSVAEAAADYPYLDATEAAIALVADCAAHSDPDYTSTALDEFSQAWPGMTEMRLRPYITAEGGAQVALPTETAMTAQQAANHANALLRELFSEPVSVTATTLCVCPDSSEPLRQQWLVSLRYFPTQPASDASSGELSVYYLLALQLDAVTGAVYSVDCFSLAGIDRASGADALEQLAPQATDALQRLLDVAGAGQTITQPLTVDPVNPDRYDLGIDGDNGYYLYIEPEGSVSMLGHFTE